ncbi:regulation of RNA splicing [Homalodisca vitripennis]|nr:regulation of RNA splicing [Homalodisca vitripennis]
MMGTTHLCVFYVATAGLQGNALGSDEEEIVLLIYVIIDIIQRTTATQYNMVLKDVEAVEAQSQFLCSVTGDLFT